MIVILSCRNCVTWYSM